MSTASEIANRELDHRVNDGIDVRLLWNPQTNRVVVAVEDERNNESFEFEVEATEALDGFRHPYVYREREHPQPSPHRHTMALEPQLRLHQNGREER